MSSTLDRIIMIAIPYLMIEYFIIYAFSTSGKTTTDTTNAGILQFLEGVFGGIGGYLGNSIPASIAFFFITIHLIMLAIFGLWAYQALNPV